MSYSKTLWIDDGEPAITAARLNKIEEGIATGYTIADLKPSTTEVNTAIGQEALNTIATVEDNITSAITNLKNEVDPQLASINTNIDYVQSIIPSAQDIVTTVNSAVVSGAYGFTTSVENTALAAVDNSGRWALSSEVSTIAANYRDEAEINALADTRITAAVTDGSIASTQYVQSYVSTAVTDATLDPVVITAIAEEAITTAVNTGTLIASAQDVLDLQTDVANNTSTINSTNNALTSLSTSYTQSTLDLQSSFDVINTSIASTEGDIDNLQIATTTLSTNQSGLSTNYQTLANEQSALSTSLTSLYSTVGTQSISIDEFSTTYATVDGVNAIKQVAINSGGDITGWTATNGTSGSSFLIQADQFAITDQTRNTTPFSIDTTTGQAVFNGKVSFNNVSDTESLVTTTALTDALANNLPSDIVTESGFQGSFNQNITTIDGGLITTKNLIAENILSTSTLKGNRIEGAYIYGSVIKASYLDLDGEVEILTNYYLVVGGNVSELPAEAITEGRYREYNAVTDTDAVRLTAFTYYRIACLSTVQPSAASGAGTLPSGVYSYDTANSGTLIKCRKKFPTFKVANAFTVYSLLERYGRTAGSVSGSTVGTMPPPMTYKLYIGSGIALNIQFIHPELSSYRSTSYSQTRWVSTSPVLVLNGTSYTVATNIVGHKDPRTSSYNVLAYGISMTVIVTIRQYVDNGDEAGESGNSAYIRDVYTSVTVRMNSTLGTELTTAFEGGGMRAVSNRGTNYFSNNLSINNQ